MYVFLTLSRATETNEKYPVGECHAVMVFVCSGDRSSAETMAIDALNEHGWSDAVIARWKTLPNETQVEDDVLRDAFADALVNGCSLVAYADPISEEEAT
jgi:hypothetical protein